MICPNCGFHTSENFCAKCGQQNHLHKDSFRGLIAHFFEHYFHYDSKFWLTLKALWFRPGKLTKAYAQKQRMTYIAPVSLYIFISAVYFLVSTSSPLHNKPGKDDVEFNYNESKSLKDTLLVKTRNDVKVESDSKALAFISRKLHHIKEKDGNVGQFMTEHLRHHMPKIFFFMIPIMAWLLKGAFFRRKDLLFVDHAIFALHYHSFWFSLFLPALFFPDGDFLVILLASLGLIAFIYMVASLKNAYSVGVGKSLALTLFLGLGYVLFLGLVFLIDIGLIILMA